MSDNRREDGTFGPGNVSNPGGRNASTVMRKIRADLREGAPDAVKFLRRVINGEESEAKISDRVRASEALLSRAVPPPKQSLKVSGQVSNPVGELSTEDIQALIRATKGEGK